MRKFPPRYKLSFGLALACVFMYVKGSQQESPSVPSSASAPPKLVSPLREAVASKAPAPDVATPVELPVKYVKFKVSARATAEAEKLSYGGQIETLGYFKDCGDATEIKAPGFFRPKSDTQPVEGRTVSELDEQLLCLKVPESAPEGPLATYPMAAAELDLLNGEEYFGADPDSVQAGTALAYLPSSEDSGYLVGVFSLAGYLCDPLDCSLGPWGLTGVAVKIEEGKASDLAEHRYLIEALTPMDHQLNAMVIPQPL